MHVRSRSRWLITPLLLAAAYAACSNEPPPKDPDRATAGEERDGFNRDELDAIGELLDADVQSDAAE